MWSILLSAGFYPVREEMPSDKLLKHQIGSYQIISELGRGGMGTVYLAEHPTIGKKVAIKILRRELSQEETILQRFFYEAKAANDIRHPNVVDVLDIGKTDDGDYYLLMEYLNGSTLFEAILSQTKFSPERLASIALQLCSALSAAHHHGIIHRDLKADNVFLLSPSYKQDVVKLLDFGVARLMEVEKAGPVLTQEGFVVGTPAYMSPEQALGEPVDQQSDIYSLGIILYQMVTGRLPFVDSNPVVVATMHVNTPLPSLRDRAPDLLPALEAVILRCLEKNKAERYKTMIEVALDLSLACRVDPRPYFDLDQQRRLGLLLAAKKENLNISPSIFEEKTQEFIEQPYVVPAPEKTLRLSPKIKQIPKHRAIFAVSGALLLGLLLTCSTSMTGSTPETPRAPKMALAAPVPVAQATTLRVIELPPIVTPIVEEATVKKAPTKKARSTKAKENKPKPVHGQLERPSFSWGSKSR
jgi:serine/threonine protein kinase